MDEDERSERALKLGFRPQKENVYNRLLPYADKLDEESTKLFYDIKTNLIKSVLAREMRPGCALWTSRLNKYMKVYGLKFSKEDHLALIRLFYDLLTIPDLEPTRISKFASTLTHLLKKKYLLSQDDLQLEWRPLYELLKRVSRKGKSNVIMYRCKGSLEHTVDNLIRVCRIYFPPSVTQEILDEFRPRLCPFSSRDIDCAMEYLELFLPVQVPPEQADVSYNLWFEEFMNLWEACHNANTWENTMASLMVKLSSHNIGYINWEPYIPIMFDRFLRTLSLPVCYRNRTSSREYKIDTSNMTLWIVCVLTGKSNTGFFHLEKFLQALESYFHPANTGSWSRRISEILRKLSFYFVQRLHCERYKTPSWETKIPDDFKLRDEDVDRFVNIMKPCVELAIFSKCEMRDVSLTLQYLSSMRPNIIVPITLEKLCNCMDNLTEPHKLISSMLGVSSVSRYLVQGARNNYPEGPTQVIPILMALLPGIDPNDIRKCFTTFNFIVQFVNLIPLVNSSEASKYYDDLTEEEHIICEATAGLEDFVLQLFDRVLSWVESNSLEFVRLEQLTGENNRKNRTEDLTEAALASLIGAILGQCSPEIFMAALRKVYNFTTEHILETKISGKMLAVICQGFAKTNPKETMKLFVPYLCEKIEEILGDNDDVIKEEIVSDELLYYMCLLTEMVDARSELLNYMDHLNRILERTLHMTSMKGSTMAAHMLELMLLSLTFTQPVEYRSCSKPYSTPLKEFLPIRHWGVAAKIKDLNITWYSPGEKEINCVQAMINKYLVPEIEKLNEYSSGSLVLTREELCKSLRIVVAILASQTVLPAWEEPALQLVESSLKPWAFELIVNGPYKVTMPDGKNVRKIVADTIHCVQKKLLEVDEGDTKCFHLIIHIYDILIFNKFRGRDFESHWKHFHAVKALLEDRLHQKKLHLRHLLIDRVMLHQEFRNESRSCSFTETHRQILLDLFELSVSRYSEVRGSAQYKLFAMVGYFSYSYTVLTPHIKEILQLDTDEHHEKFKGCLYILIGPKSTPIIARHDWSFISETWPLLVRSKPSEKLSIVNLIQDVSNSIDKFFPTIAINLVIPDKCLKSAYDFAKNVPEVTFEDFQTVIDNSEETLKALCDRKRKAYCDAVDKLLDAAVNGNLHWRYHYLALNLMQVLVHQDVKYNSEVVKYFLHSLNNESIAVRKLSLRVVLYILIQNKPKFKKVTFDPVNLNHVSNCKLRPGVRSDNKWILYNSENLPKTAADWNKRTFVDKPYEGFYPWKKPIEIYAPPPEQPSVSKRLDDLSPEEKEIYEFFNSKENMDTLIKYFSLEEDKDRDRFSTHRYLLFKYYFKMFEDTSLDILLPSLENLVKDKQEKSQRCAAEMVCGFVRGSKHWNFEQLEKLWSKLIPLLRIAITNSSSEIALDWGVCMALAVHSRDPNRMHWLMEFLMDNPLGEQTSHINSTRLMIVYCTILKQLWRNSELLHRLLKYLQAHLSHPFQNIRERISSCLWMIFNCRGFCENEADYPKLEDFFKNITPRLEVLYEYTLKRLNVRVDESMEVDDCDSSISIKSDEDKENHIRLFKIIAKYITMNSVRSVYSVVPEFFELLPLTCVLLNNDTQDEEISEVCIHLLTALSQSLILRQYVPSMLAVVRKVADCSSWSARAAIADFIPIFVFHNLATLVSEEDWVLEIQSIVLQLLEDVQPEVRISASKVISGLLHCKFIPKPMELLELFKAKAKTKLKRRDLNHSNNKTVDSNGLRFRHAGVLGLCAFISSHPYDVPDILPDVFGQLGPHLNDPQPIPATIRITMGNFKRTHLDNWEVHKMKFTEEELMVLSDLTVPPSYYA